MLPCPHFIISPPVYSSSGTRTYSPSELVHPLHDVIHGHPHCPYHLLHLSWTWRLRNPSYDPSQPTN